MIWRVLVLGAVLATGRCQLADLVFPSITGTLRSFSDAIVHQPAISLATQASGNLISSLTSGISSVPLALARSFDVSSNFPNLISNKNTADLTDQTVAEFSAGLQNEDAKLEIKDLVSKYGYPVEHHVVVTEDGYILTLFRIPSNGSVVFLMHGLLGSADDYVVAGPESGLAYLLADEGYDVWLGNARGNKHSRRHEELIPTDSVFWDFSWDEIGRHDLPAMIDYVLDETDKKTVKYIGHSQGTTSFFVMASEKPDYNEKVSLMVALSPVAFMSHATSPILRLLAPTSRLIHGFTKIIGAYEFLPDSFVVRMMKKVMCGSGPIAEILCSNVLFLIVGFGFEQLNVTNLPVIYGHIPSGAAAKQFAHYAQGAITGEFRKYDYGPAENLERYGSKVPPKYNLENVRAPVSLFYSDADWLSHPSDVDNLYNSLGNAVDIHKVPFEPFNHLDFIWGKNFKELIYNRIRKLMTFF